MTLNFSGNFDELKQKLAPIGGDWDESKPNREVLRLNGGLMNWHTDSGKIIFQGKAACKVQLEENVKNILSDTEESSPLQRRITELVAEVSGGMFEREEIIAVALLGALCGQNTFLYGPPGTAKSLISRRIACAFASPAYFEYLMNRFSTPEEVFGPVSIKALKEDQYIRKTENYLPQAEFAFLDEIWKSSPAILNTLLTLINERTFRNGERIEKAPLKALIAASNETPEANQGLDALYDRFVIRLMVGPISLTKHFDQLLNSKPTEADISITDELLVKPDEWVQWREQLHDVQLSAETLTIIHVIREELTQQYDELKVYVSDRRWQRAATLMKASAFFNDRTTTNHSDALLLQHCLWTQEDNREAVLNIVAQAIQDTGFESNINIVGLDREKEELDKEINKELFHSSDIYETKLLDGKEYFCCKEKFISKYSGYHNQDKEHLLYISKDKLKTTDKFRPLDENGNELVRFLCQFDGQGTCEIHNNHDNYDIKNFQPKVLFHRGDKKSEINERLVKSLLKSVNLSKQKLTDALVQVEVQRAGYEKQLVSPFVPAEKIKVAISGIIEQINKLKLRIKDCERLEELCR